MLRRQFSLEIVLYNISLNFEMTILFFCFTEKNLLLGSHYPSVWTQSSHFANALSHPKASDIEREESETEK